MVMAAAEWAESHLHIYWNRININELICAFDGTFAFLPRDAMLARYVVVCPSAVGLHKLALYQSG